MSVATKSTAVRPKMNKPKEPTYKYCRLDELRTEEVTVEDVLDALNHVFGEMKVLHFNPTMFTRIAGHFDEGGVAANITITLDTFKMAVHFLTICRTEVDYRVMRCYWPLFHHLYRRLDFADLDSAVAHFYSVTELFADAGFSVHKIQQLQESFQNYKAEFGAARRFIIDEPYQLVDEDYRQKCKRLCFYVMLHPRRGIKELTVETMTNSTANKDAIDNLLQFLYHLPALMLLKIPNVDNAEQMEPLAVGLVRQIYRNELHSTRPQLKKEMLQKIVEGLTANKEIWHRTVCPPMLDAQDFANVFHVPNVPQQQPRNHQYGRFFYPR